MSLAIDRPMLGRSKVHGTIWLSLDTKRICKLCKHPNALLHCRNFWTKNNHVEDKLVFLCCSNINLKFKFKYLIHLTGAATNPWIIFQSDDSFIKIEIGTNQFNLVQFYSTFLLHILHFSTLSIFSGQNLFNLWLHLRYSNFYFKLHLPFNLKL